jgi:hypothetical protein
MRRRIIHGVVTLTGVTTLTFALLGQAQEPWFGTWKLNLAKSKYSPGPPPKSTTTKLEPWQGGFKNTTDVLTATGESRHVEYAGKFDGKDNTVTGNPDVDTNTYRRIDDHTYEVVAKKSGKSTLTSRIVISPDGKARTVTQTGQNPQGETVNNTVVYDRQ